MTLNVKSNAHSLEHIGILEWIREGSSVLDLGCGDGELLDLLIREKGVKAQGIEIDEQAIYRCVARGISVFQEDIDNGLLGYGDKAFDYVILNQSLQQVKKLDMVLKDALRVGKEVIIGFPNFANYQARFQMSFKGRAPVTPSLPYGWYDTPNLHFLSILDFLDYCRERKVKIKKTLYLGKKNVIKILPNLFALTGIFLIFKEQSNEN